LDAAIKVNNNVAHWIAKRTQRKKWQELFDMGRIMFWILFCASS